MSRESYRIGEMEIDRRSSVYDEDEFRSVECQVCNKTCSNYPAYRKHMWKNHGDAIRSGSAKIKMRPYEIGGSINAMRRLKSRNDRR